MERQNRRSRAGGFSRIDLVAVLATLATASVIALPVGVRKLRNRSCSENLRQVSLATQLYALDNNDLLPGCQHSLPSWVQGLKNYCSPDCYICPNTTEPRAPFTIALNDFLTPHPYGAHKLNYSALATIPTPARTLLFAEATPGYSALKFDHFHFADAHENGFTLPRFREQVDIERHGGGANYLFPDGHLESIAAPDVEARLASSGSRFVQPEGASCSENSRRTDSFTLWR